MMIMALLMRACIIGSRGGMIRPRVLADDCTIVVKGHGAADRAAKPQKRGGEAAKHVRLCVNQ